MSDRGEQRGRRWAAAPADRGTRSASLANAPSGPGSSAGRRARPDEAPELLRPVRRVLEAHGRELATLRGMSTPCRPQRPARPTGEEGVGEPVHARHLHAHAPEETAVHLQGAGHLHVERHGVVSPHAGIGILALEDHGETPLERAGELGPALVQELEDLHGLQAGVRARAPGFAQSAASRYARYAKGRPRPSPRRTIGMAWLGSCLPQKPERVLAHRVPERYSTSGRSRSAVGRPGADR